MRRRALALVLTTAGALAIAPAGLAQAGYPDSGSTLLDSGYAASPSTTSALAVSSTGILYDTTHDPVAGLHYYDEAAATDTAIPASGNDASIANATITWRSGSDANGDSTVTSYDAASSTTSSVSVADVTGNEWYQGAAPGGVLVTRVESDGRVTVLRRSSAAPDRTLATLPVGATLVTSTADASTLALGWNDSDGSHVGTVNLNSPGALTDISGTDGPALTSIAMSPGYIGYLVDDYNSGTATLIRVSRTSGSRTQTSLPVIPDSFGITDDASAWSAGPSVSTLGTGASDSVQTLADTQPLFTGGSVANAFVAFSYGVSASDSVLESFAHGSASTTVVVDLGAQHRTGSYITLSNGRVSWLDDATTSPGLTSTLVSDTSPPQTPPGFAYSLYNGHDVTPGFFDASDSSGLRTIYERPNPDGTTQQLWLALPNAQPAELIPTVRGPASISGARILYHDAQSVAHVFDLVSGLNVTVPDGYLWGPWLTYENSDGSVSRLDLRAPGTPGTQILPTGTFSTSPVGWGIESVWGDWVAGESAADDTTAIAVNTVTHVVRTLGYGSVCDGADGHPWKLTDVVAVLASGCATPTAVALDGSTVPPVAAGGDVWAFDADGNQIALADPYPRVLTLPVPDSAAPRLLDEFAPAKWNRAGSPSWNAEFDGSKNLGDCSLAISGPNGLVRTVSCLNQFGDEMINWDGTDTNGAAVPAGTYTWTLTASATDGSGPLVGPAGEPGPFTGTLTVTDSADTTAPAVTFTTPPPAYAPGHSATAAFTVTDPDDSSGVVATCTLDGVSNACASPYTMSGLRDGTHHLTITASDPARNVSAPVTATFVTDSTAPTAGLTAPTALATLSSTAVVAWKGADATSGVASYDVRYERAAPTGGFGAWLYPTAWQHTTHTSVTSPTLAAGYDYCFSVRSRDRAGNTSSWSGVRCISKALDDRALTATSAWVRRTGSGYYGGTYTSTATRGAALTYAGAQTDRIGIVATTCATCGTVNVYVHNVYVGKISLYSATTHRERILMLPKLAYRTGTISLIAAFAKATVVDGFVTIRT